ncbi:hypothetical protein NEOLEDRAFT_1131698 [Neolentinus lepideus HHB14362 ss-1]|uniref:VOC domain-containing protein n=1 Tax=Neolentinus lepideus HHB14362 ss-1 TaxID=1314782 RepID=A0A165TI80_9AGAM|nr:hypothetical protein NEOLEDRAFT_1131698 [Neolentinus lepideus HHB14362 ss-1]
MSSNVPFSNVISGIRQPNSHSVGGTYQPAQINGQPILSHLDHLVLTVADIDASVEFYMKVLGMEKEVFGPDDAPRVALKFGMQKVNLQHEYAKIQPHAGEATKGSADLCFIVKQDIADFLRHLEKLEENPEIGIIRTSLLAGDTLQRRRNERQGCWNSASGLERGGK